MSRLLLDCGPVIDVGPAAAVPPVIDEQPIEHTRQPRSRLLQGRDLVEPRLQAQQQLLHQVLGVVGIAGQAQRQPMQVVQPRADGALEPPYLQ